MGEEQATPLGDDGFVANAQSEGITDTPPVGDETTTEAVVETGAEGLTGDETEEEIRAHLEAEFKDLPQNRREQILRWREGNVASKTLKSDVERLTGEAEGGKAARDGLMEVARAIGPKAVQVLKDEGPQAFVTYANSPAQPETAPAALDASDPVQAALIQMQQKLEAMEQEKAQGTMQQKQQEIGAHMLAGAKALDLPADDANTSAKMVLQMAESYLYAPGNAKNPSLPTEAEADAAIAAASASFSALKTLISGEAEKKIEDGTPKTPVVAVESETTAVEKKSDDWQSEEVDGFIGRAQAGIKG